MLLLTAVVVIVKFPITAPSAVLMFSKEVAEPPKGTFTGLVEYEHEEPSGQFESDK